MGLTEGLEKLMLLLLFCNSYTGTLTLPVGHTLHAEKEGIQGKREDAARRDWSLWQEQCGIRTPVCPCACDA